MRRAVALLLLAACRDRIEVPSADFFVAPDGSDAGPGTLERPFATIEHAANQKPGARIAVRGGTYFLSRTLVLRGLSGLTLEAFPGERPVISGGVPVSGWTFDGARWTATVGHKFKQLFVNGERAPRPRLPKTGFYRVAALPDAGRATPWHEGQTRFTFQDDNLRAWRNIADVEVVALHFWVESRLPVAGVDEAAKLVTFGRRSVFRLTEDHSQKPARYYVENVFEALDTPGQWYLDGTKLYYLGERPREAIAPRLTQLARLENCERVTLRGLTFAHAEPAGGNAGWPSKDVCGAPQAAVTSPGAVLLTGSRSCVLERCTIEHVGSYGVEIADRCFDNRIDHCTIRDLGAGGVKIGETALSDSPTGRNELTDCEIGGGGRIFHSAVGVWVGHSGGNRIMHNHVHDFYYTGLSVGWSWGYGPSGARDNRIEFNHVHHIGQGLLSDMGGIYTLGVSPGTVIRNNVFHDIESRSYGGWGIYFDEGTTGVVAEKNIVYRCTSNSFHQHYGKENIVRNNILAGARDAQIARTRAEGHLSFTFERNIVAWRQGQVFSGDWSGSNYRFDWNLYFGKGEWKRAGQDEHSIGADPMFADPDRGDYTLKADSPAFKLGFEPIDVSSVGPRN